jgi:inosine-uridine nucleoside N-ribohydrolase
LAVIFVWITSQPAGFLVEKMKRLLIDTDVGLDDIVAIAMLASNGKYVLEAFTTVNGLTPPLLGKDNLLRVLSFMNIKSCVVAGASFPVTKSSKKYSFPKQDVINASCLSFLKDILPQLLERNSQSPSVEDFLLKKVSKYPKKLTILCLGPLTNIALAVQKYGVDFTSKIGELIIIGGAISTPGNVFPNKFAEYNIYLDPEAANIVFQSGIPTTLVTLDACRLVPAKESFKKKVGTLTPQRRCAIVIQKTTLANEKDFKYFYDPLASAILVDPKIIKGVSNLEIRVDVAGKNRGRTAGLKNKNGISVVKKIDPQRFYNQLLDVL